MADRRRIVVTGACGKIAGQLLPALESRYDVVKLDVRNTRGGNSSLTLGPGEEATPQEVLPDVHICDLLEEDRSTLYAIRRTYPPFRGRLTVLVCLCSCAVLACRPLRISEKHACRSRLFQGVDTVVHCGFAQPPPAPAQPLNSGGGTDMAEAGAVFGAEAMFTAEHNNVRMAFNIFQTAVEQGVARVVMASSNHAADFYEDKILRGEHDTVDPDGRALSDNYYGWAVSDCFTCLPACSLSARVCRARSDMGPHVISAVV
jgi:nucleoside-diphosphate-sugar epimerase